MFEVAAEHDAPVGWHTGYDSGYIRWWSRASAWQAPSLAGDAEESFPDVPIIFQHGGMQGPWRDTYVEQCCEVASTSTTFT